MKINGLNYHLINVKSPLYEDYSFIVTTSYENLTDEEIIDMCIENGLFDKKIEYAEVDYQYDENDIKVLPVFNI